MSALSQIISFHTFDDVTADEILQQLKASEACRSGQLIGWECYRVPRRFHALYSATWRRYVYVFPLNPGPYCGFDVDVDFVNQCLHRSVHSFVMLIVSVFKTDD